MSTLRLILGDQLSDSLSALRDLDPEHDVVLMFEVDEEARYVPHHQQKLVLVLAAMRHFAQRLRARGVRVDYVKLDDPDNRGSFSLELERALQRHPQRRLVATEPGEWRVLEMLQGWPQRYGIELELRQDDRFLCSLPAFRRWAQGKKQLRMEFFYRQMRQKTGWLMRGEEPLGGAWNFDAENRKPLDREQALPPRLRFAPDALTGEVVQLVRERYGHHFGTLDSFAWAVNREQALQVLAHFIEHGLPQFGDYQDAMKQGEDFLFHSVLSPYLNIGLLLAREVCEAALAAHARGEAPLNAVEGFVRQILGWREYVRGIYWTFMPQYAQGNFLDAQRPLPDFYWTGETRMNCLRECIRSTQQHAYAHHIQRLMVTGNFALLAGIAPAEVERWYLLVYADAFEWVELPNTHGMVLHADGGLLGSKPYAASGAYIQRMSDYCTRCVYRPQLKNGPKACPFNYLYWDFLQRNEARLGRNPRLAMPYRTLHKLPAERREAIAEDAARFLATLE